MKNVSTILTHLISKPQFKSIQTHGCYNKFLKLLPQKFKKGVAFVYIQNETLFVALSHPGYKMELNYNKDLLKSLLKMIREHNPECSGLVAHSVVIFNSLFYAEKPHGRYQSDPKYNELALGVFQINTTDSGLREKFDTIKEHIYTNLADDLR